MKIWHKLMSLLIVTTMSASLLILPAFATGENRPLGISLMSSKVTPGAEMRFHLYDEPNARQNINKGGIIPLGNDLLVDLEYMVNYPGGVWGISRVFTADFLDAAAGGGYSFTVPEEEYYYRLSVKSADGESRYVSEIFEVVSEPYATMDERVIETGDTVHFTLYDENGNRWQMGGNQWSRVNNMYYIDVFGTGRNGFIDQADLGMNDSGHTIVDNGNGRYSFPAGNEPGDFYLGWNFGTGRDFREIDSTSYEVIQGDGVVANDDVVDDNEDEDSDLPPILEPVYDEDAEDICDPGEFCPEDEDEDDNGGHGDFRISSVIRANLPNFHFIGLRRNIFEDDDFDLSGYDYENDPDDVVVEEIYSCDDLEGRWSADLINNMLAQNIYPTKKDGEKTKCRPDEDMPRKNLMAWLLFSFYPDLADSALNLDPANVTSPYTDLDGNDPFTPFVLTATFAEIVSGKNNCATAGFSIGCKFGSEETVNRAEILKMVFESSGLFTNTDEEIADLKVKYPLKDPILMFEDMDDDSAWYYGYLYFGTANGIINGFELGNGKFEAGMSKGLTFEQSAKIITLSMEL